MKKFYECLCRAEIVIAYVFLIVMVALIFSAAIGRLLAHPLNWGIDMATCLFAWACFFCADIAWRNNRLMSVNLLVDRLPEKGKTLCRMFNYFVMTAFLAYFIIAGSWLSYVSRARSFQGIPEFSYSWITMSVPVGSLLLLITTLLKIREEFRGSRLAN